MNRPILRNTAESFRDSFRSGYERARGRTTTEATLARVELAPVNLEYLDEYEGYDNPQGINDLRVSFHDILNEARRDAATEPDIMAIRSPKRRQAAIERRARAQATADFRGDIEDFALDRIDFSYIDEEDYADEEERSEALDDALQPYVNELMSYMTLSDDEWVGTKNPDGTRRQDGAYYDLAREIESMFDGTEDALEEEDEDIRLIDEIIDENEDLIELESRIDDLRVAYAKILAKPWSPRARSQAKKLLERGKPIRTKDLRAQLEEEWSASKREFYNTIRDEVGDEFEPAELSAMLVSWDIDEFTALEQTRITTLKEKKTGKFMEALNSGSKRRRALKYLGIGAVTAGAGLAAGAIASFLAPVAAVGAIASRFGSRYASWTGRRQGAVETQSAQDIEEYRRRMSTLDNLDEDEFNEALENEAGYNALDIIEARRKSEQIARAKSVGFAAITMAAPGVLMHIPGVGHFAESVVGFADRHTAGIQRYVGEHTKGVRHYVDKRTEGIQKAIGLDDKPKKVATSTKKQLTPDATKATEAAKLSSEQLTGFPVINPDTNEVLSGVLSENISTNTVSNDTVWGEVVNHLNGDQDAANSFLRSKELTDKIGGTWHNLNTASDRDDWLSIVVDGKQVSDKKVVLEAIRNFLPKR